MEYCCGGDLSKYIYRCGRIAEYKVLYFLQQLASALKYLREKGVAHMDLKPHNLLLHKDAGGRHVLKVGDFGIAQHMSCEGEGGEGGAGGARGVRGSPLYMAPEVLRGHYDARADLWSTGVIMYECLFGAAPYSSRSLHELVDKLQRRAPIHIPPHSSISPGCVDLLTRLLQHDPDQRISYEEFFAHDYLDLENMPTRESYLIAVSLSRRAVVADGAGRARDALQLYTAALRRLVPLARHSPALTPALTRYMDRAEELKKFLKEQKGDAACHFPSEASDVNQELIASERTASDGERESERERERESEQESESERAAGREAGAGGRRARGLARFLKLPSLYWDNDKRTEGAEGEGGTDGCRVT